MKSIAILLVAGFGVGTAFAQFSLSPTFSTLETDSVEGLAWADFDGDGDLDLAAVGEAAPVRVYASEAAGLVLRWSSVGIEYDRAVAWGDYDGDGDPDLAVAAFDAAAIIPKPNRLYRNDGGNFTLVWSSVEIEANSGIAWADFDLDGDLDLAFTNQSSSSIRIYENQTGNFASRWSGGSGFLSHALAVGDFDEDGDADIAVATSNGPQVLTNESAFSFRWSWSEPGSGVVAVAVGDFDRDGAADLAFGRSLFGQVNLYRNQGGFIRVAAIPEPSASLAWADVDRDGDLDLVVGDGDDTARVLRNDGGSFSRSYSSAVSGGVIAVGDRDRDGALDLVLGGRPGLPDPIRLFPNAGKLLEPGWTPGDGASARDLAWGDWDGDGDLDLAVANCCTSDPVRVFVNDGSGGLSLGWSAPVIENSTSLAWGDWDQDGDLDLAVGNLFEPNRVYRNDGANLVLAWSSLDRDNTNDVAWADYDQDGDLDLAAANLGQPNRIYANLGSGVMVSAWVSSEVDDSRELAWSDVDGDTDPDLAVANSSGGPIRLYRNDASVMVLAWSSPDLRDSESLAWGDIDGDGDADLAIGNASGQPNQVYRNDGGNLISAWSSAELDDTGRVAWGDIDGDGDLDLAVANRGTFPAVDAPSRVYLNENGVLGRPWTTSEVGEAYALAWADVDRDGDLDLALGYDLASIRLFTNQMLAAARLPDRSTRAVVVRRPGATPAGYYHSSAEFVSSPVMLSYVLVDPDGDRAHSIAVEYSLAGGGGWRPATMAVGGDGRFDLAASAAGIRHQFAWDAIADAATGDDVRLRVSVLATHPSRIAGPFQLGRVGAASPPFRVREGACFIPALTARTNLFGVRSGNGATFSWDRDPLAAQYHVNSVIDKLDLITPGPHRWPVVGARATGQCEAIAPLVSCRDDDAITDPAALLLYRVLSACGPSGSHAGPP